MVICKEAPGRLASACSAFAWSDIDLIATRHLDFNLDIRGQGIEKLVEWQLPVAGV